MATPVMTTTMTMTYCKQQQHERLVTQAEPLHTNVSIADDRDLMNAAKIANSYGQVDGQRSSQG